MDKDILEQRTHISDDVTASAFVTFKRSQSAQVTSQIVTSSKPGILHVRMAPEPRDILWKHLLRKGRKSRLLGGGKKWLVSVAVWSLTIFWLFPITFILSLTSISSLTQHFPFLKQFIVSSFVVRAFIQNILPTMLVTLCMSILPSILLELSKQQDFISFSELEDTVLGRHYHFAIFNVLIVFLLGTTFLSTILDVVYEPTMLIQLLANALPQGANFFLNYILFNSSTHAMELVLLGSQLFGHLFFVLPFVSKTPRLKLRYTTPWSFPYYYYYPAHILVLVITLTYSVIQPLILIFAVLYFAFALVVYRHQYLYCYLRKYESDGSRHYRRMVRYTSDGLLIFQMTVVGILYLKGVLTAATAVLPLIIFTAWAKIRLHALFYDRTKHVSSIYDPTASFSHSSSWIDDIWKLSLIKSWYLSGRYEGQEQGNDATSEITTVAIQQPCHKPQQMLDVIHVKVSYTRTEYVMADNLNMYPDDSCSKLADLRSQAESANALCEEYEAKIKQLEQEHTSKDHELLSLQIRIKNLEEQLDKTENSLQTTSTDYNKADLRAEEAERKVQKLEQELLDKEQGYEELTEKYNSAKNELDELARQMDDL
ncbi:DUF221-domain-containing protein [Rhizopus microsporus]|uniref:DUF221-domain-containing protein n=1 Tax=Rhizopus microsporus TaxID=58291 RepID=A0A1X0SE57_RHIZD|nr:DUF221-domain-containing protein [Rhizopus microsporus]